ncbi:jg24396, partial [Pararge aegeria aegeria]
MSPVLVVLAMCALARADRYADYAGASMPHYSMEEGSRDAAPQSEDYPERSPDVDAPIAFDYKYEEELRDNENNLPMKFDEENWHTPGKGLKEPLNLPDDDELQKHGEESVPKVKASDKNGRHRPRMRNKGVDRGEENYRRKAASEVRSQRIDKDIVNNRNDYYYTNKGRTREDNRIESDDVNFRGTKEKVIRRKPRDRRINHRRLDVDAEDVDEDSKSLESDGAKPLKRDDEAEYVQNRRENSQLKVERHPRPVPKKTRMR